MKQFLTVFSVVYFATILGLEFSQSSIQANDDAPKLRVLLVTGGGYHDYDFQTIAIKKAFKDRGIDIEWKVVNDGGKGTTAEIDFYKDPNWAKGWDVVIHNECFANTTNEEYIRSITDAHKSGANAVVIHCAMHTYRKAKIDDWREFLGVTSRRHEHKSKYVVKNVAADHPVMQSFPSTHTMPTDELYVIEKLWPNSKVLASSPSEKDGRLHPVFWTNQFGKGPSFWYDVRSFERHV